MSAYWGCIQDGVCHVLCLNPSFNMTLFLLKQLSDLFRWAL